MSLGHSPRIVSSGLNLFLDASNPKSYSTGTLWNNISGATLSTPYTNLTKVEVLVVGGGGGAGADVGGGGGAGGLIYDPAFLVTPGTSYSVTVGAGGSAGAPGANGGNSVFGTLTAFGGGGGSYYYDCVGRDGGSGGGGNPTSPNSYRTDGLRRGGLAVAGQGFPGSGQGSGAGGVGGSGAGGIGTPQNNNGSNGGNGLYFPQFAAVGGFPAGWFAGGGGAGSSAATSIGLGGLGGGTGSSELVTGRLSGGSGIPNTGGGAGSSGNGANSGGVGGSGIIIVRYPEPQRATGGSVTFKDGYVLHTFTSGTSAFVTNSYVSNSSLINGPIYSSTSTGVLNFEGTNDYLLTPFIPSVTAGTISVWFKLNILKDYNTIFDNSIGADDWEMWTYATGVTRFRTTAGNLDYIVDSGVLSINTYYNITVTWDNTSASLYQNGVLITQDTTPGTKINPSYLYIGGGNAGNTKLNGSVGRISIYDSVLTAAEVLQNFNSLRGRYGI